MLASLLCVLIWGASGSVDRSAIRWTAHHHLHEELVAGDGRPHAAMQLMGFMKEVEQIVTVVTPPPSTSLTLRVRLSGWLSSIGSVWPVALPLPLMLWASSTAKEAPVLIVLSCCILASVSMSVMNKHMSDVFPAICLLVVLQMVVTDVALLCLEGRRLFRSGLSWEAGLWACEAVLGSCVLCTGLWMLKVTTLSTVLILRNVLPLLAYPLEKWFVDSTSSLTTPMLVSMMLILGGTVFYAKGNVTVTLDALAFVFLNCSLVVLDRLFQKVLLTAPRNSPPLPFIMLLQNTVGILPMLLVASMNQEAKGWSNMLATTDFPTWFWIVMTGLYGCCLGYLSLRCQQLVSATSFLVMQNGEKALLIVLGAVLFGDHMQLVQVLGCVTALLGTAWYGALRLPIETAEKKSGNTEAGNPDFEASARSLKTNADPGCKDFAEAA